MTIIQFKKEIRLLDFKYDPWGEAMSAFFELCARMYKRGLTIPAEWQYRPSPLTSDPTEKDNYWYSLFARCGRHQLLAIGNLLHRYTEYLRRKGKDY